MKWIRLQNKMHGTEIILQVRAEPDELGRYQLSKGQLRKAQSTLCPDPGCRKLGCGADAAGQRGGWLNWLVDSSGLARPADLPGDTWVQLSCRVRAEPRPWSRPPPEEVAAGCYVGPYYERGCGPTDAPAQGYLVWQPGELIVRFRHSVIIAEPQRQALHHATRCCWERIAIEAAGYRAGPAGDHRGGRQNAQHQGARHR